MAGGPLRAGELNRRVTIEELSSEADDQGGRETGWVALRTVWARAEPVNGKEGLIQGTLRSGQGWRVTIRFAADLTTANRLLLRDAGRDWLLDIQSLVDPDGRRERLVMLCDGKPG